MPHTFVGHSKSLKQFSPTIIQRQAAKFLYLTPKGCLWVPMGKGKTAIMLTEIVKLQDAAIIKSALVISVIRVIEEVWRQEAAKWKHTAHLTFSLIRGTHQQRVDALNKPADVYLINYELLYWLKQQIDIQAKFPNLPYGKIYKEDKDPSSFSIRGEKAALARFNQGENTARDLFILNQNYFSIGPYLTKFLKRVSFDYVIYDEITKLRHISSKRFKAWREVNPIFRFRYGLTGTPAANGYKHLWGQFFMIDDGKRLGSNITTFRKRFMEPHPYVKHVYNLRKDADKEIQALIAPIIFEVDPATLKEEPPVINDIWVTIPEKARKQYEKMERELAFEIKEQGITVEAFNENGKGTKLLQMANGAVWHEDDYGNRGWTWLHDAKLEALDDVIEEAAGAPVLIIYQFIPDLERLRTRYGKNLYTLKSKKDIVECWNAGEIPLLAMHPKSGGHGLNLQYGGYIQAWLGLTYDLELYQQTIGRLHGRHGQTRQVYIHRILAWDTFDLIPRESLLRKANTQQDLFKAVANYLKNKKKK